MSIQEELEKLARKEISLDAIFRKHRIRIFKLTLLYTTTLVVSSFGIVAVMPHSYTMSKVLLLLVNWYILRKFFFKPTLTEIEDDILLEYKEEICRLIEKEMELIKGVDDVEQRQVSGDSNKQ